MGWVTGYVLAKKYVEQKIKQYDPDLNGKINHADLENILPDQHHPKLHASTHASGGEDAITTKLDLGAFGGVDPEAHAARHAAGGADAIPAGGIARSQLEYPTEDVTLAYLAAINKVNFDVVAAGGARPYGEWVVTSDSFTDKAVKNQCTDGTGLLGRYVDELNWYEALLDSGATTADFQINIQSAGSSSTLASEAVDIGTDSRHLLKLNIAGSTISGFRNDMTTAAVSVTDTTFASGAYGVLQGTGGGSSSCPALTGILLAPTSPLPKAQRIIEAEITGSGTEDDPYRPNFKQELAEISQLTNISDFLLQEAKRYEALKAKGFTDEEIKLLLGYIPKHQVDLASITWGTFEYKNESTMLAVITGDNPYQSGAILRQEEHAKSKNLKVLKPPRDLSEARELHRQIKADRPDIIAGAHNLAYHCIGDENLELLAVADFYDGFVRGTYNIKDLEKLPAGELKRTIIMWMKRLDKANVPAEEKDKHMEKLKRVLKR